MTIPGEYPDSAMVIVSAAYNIGGAQAGSTLWIDDIDFTNSVGIAQQYATPIQMFPNPADESLEFSLPKELNAASILISSMDGKMIKELRTHSSSTIKINTTSIAQGMYVMYAKNTKGTIVASGKFTVKH